MHRKKPFSGKQKKAQLQAKKARKRQSTNELSSEDEVEIISETAPAKQIPLESVFANLSANEVEMRKIESRKPLVKVYDLEIGYESVYPDNNMIDFPKRPKWTLSDTKQSLESRELAYFTEWKNSVYKNFPFTELSYFEHNLQVWRQLWRVVEISDIILLVLDSRHPILHFPPTIYDYVVNQQKKQLVIVFNKIDLVGEEIVNEWIKYFKNKFPLITTASFSCYPKEVFVSKDHETEILKKRSKRKYKRYFQAVGVHDVFKACRDVKLLKKGNLIDWNSIIQKAEKRMKDFEERESKFRAMKDDGEQFLGRSRRRQKLSNSIISESEEESNFESDSEHESEIDIQELALDPLNEEISNDKITIGTIGHPNVGKSSLINGLLGKTVVSVSKTPGHTKHFQTICLSDEVRLCDCPGLVFPAKIPKPLQILSGMYRIAQVQEPYTAVTYLAERIPLVEILDLKHPDQEEPSFFWSGWAICEAFALQRGFLTPKAARPDVYRAANLILRMANDGRLLLVFRPLKQNLCGNS